MRLLLTRAAEDAARTKAVLEALGHEVLVSPALVFESTDESWPRRPPEGLIATSSRAFSASTDATRPDVSHVPLYLVGARTEAAARRHGCLGPATVAPDAASLVALLRARPPMRLLYLAGADRKPDLEAGLEATRHRLMVIETYEAVAAESLTPEVGAALRDARLDTILHYSRRSAAIFLELCGAAGIDPAGFRHLCLSRDVAEPLSAAGCHDFAVAATPDEAALLALLPKS